MENPTIIGIVAALCTTLGIFVREWVEQRKWRRIHEQAKATVKSDDPSSTNDPHEAVTEALISQNRSRIVKTSGLIRLDLMNGSNPHPKVDPPKDGDS